jgi:hypothetical protein
VPKLTAILVEAILADAVAALNSGSWRPPGGVATASAFEKEAHRQLQLAAKSHCPEIEIKLHSGKRFPDIVFQGTEFGVEIKTAQKGWSCLGNSVAASTLVDGVSEIYLLFASGEKYFEARFARYEDCVKSVEVTHSPRYVLDMELDPSESYLKGIGHTLSEMLAMDDPIGCVVQEARRNLKPGERVWWISEQHSTPLKLVTWESLSSEKKSELISFAFAFFPGAVLKHPRADYTDFVLWLIQRKAVFCSSVRDNFSAGGRVNELEIGGLIVDEAPKVVGMLRSHLNEVRTVIKNVDVDEWAGRYGCLSSECDTFEKRFTIWSNIVRPLLLKKLKQDDDYMTNCITTFLGSADVG